jgi:catechol 2,3-dioxygenase-like lactoylglutathione lyase family enzyme
MPAIETRPSTVGLDHVGFIVADLAQSHRLFSDLGFTLTPRADHTRTTPQGQVVPAGSAQHSIMLDAGYIELMQITDPQAGHQLTPATAERYGLHVLALAVADAAAWHADCLRRQLPVGPLLDWSRPVRTPEREGLARFCFFDAPWQARDPSYLCWVQHLTPELVRSPSLLAHANQAQALTGVTYSGPRAGLQAWGRRLLGAGARPPKDGSGLGRLCLQGADLTLTEDADSAVVRPSALVVSFNDLLPLQQRAQALGLPCHALPGPATGCRIDLRQACGLYLDAVSTA